jgi:hypothetical protein
MKRFDITLRNEKESSIRFIILLLILLHVLFFCYLLFNEQFRKEGIVGLIITLLYSGYRLLITNTSKQKFSFGSGYFFVLSFLFLANDSWWLFAIELILSTASSIALTPVILAFTSTDIKQSKFSFKKYQWNEFSNVILKDNILTLDFKNNKILQAQIDTAGINEEAFNTFAKDQLNKN